MTTPQGTKRATVRSQRAQRKAENRLGHGIVAYSTAAVKEAFVAGNWDNAITGLGVCIRERQPWALRAWLEAAGAIGAEQRVVVALVQQLGARDEQELRELVEHGRRLQRLEDSSASSPEEDLASCLRLLKFLLREHPEWRVRVISELSSGAVEVNGNGAESNGDGVKGT